MLSPTRSLTFLLLLLLQRFVANTGSVIHFPPEAQPGNPDGAQPDGVGKEKSQVGRGPQLLDTIQRVAPEAAYIIDVLNALGEHGEASLGHELGFLSDLSTRTNGAVSSGPLSIKVSSLAGWSSGDSALEKRTNSNEPLGRLSRGQTAKNKRHSSPSVAEGSENPVHDDGFTGRSLDTRSYKAVERYFFFDSLESWLDEFMSGLKRDTVLNVGKVGGIVFLYYFAPGVLEWIEQNVGLN